jgi:chromosome segregation ATPase
VGLAEFSGFFKDQSAREVLETIKQDWSQLTLIQKESERLRDPSSSEGYEKWRNLTPMAASKKPCFEDGPSRIGEGSLKRKKVSNEEDLMKQLERLQIELGKSKGDKAALERMMMEGDKSRVFLNEQLESRDAKIVMLELQLSKGKAVIEESEKERGRLIFDCMQSSSELEALKADFDGYRENVEYNQDKFLHVRAELLDQIEKYEELNKKYMMIESRLAELQEFERKGKEEEVFKADLAAKKIEIRTLKLKFDKEREKVKQLTKRLEVSEKHKEQIDTNNNTLNRNNMLLIEKMAKVDEQMDEAAIHARIIRANARRVGRDIFRYRQSLAETDAFLEKIENRGLAFLPGARDMDEEED